MTDRMKIVFNRQLKRNDLARFMATQKPVDVVMEACYSSHTGDGALQRWVIRSDCYPHSMSPHFVRGNKSDHNDAVAIAEAAHRPNILPVPIKTLEQSDIQPACIACVNRYVTHRTGLINQTRGGCSVNTVSLPDRQNQVIVRSYPIVSAKARLWSPA